MRVGCSTCWAACPKAVCLYHLHLSLLLLLIFTLTIETAEDNVLYAFNPFHYSANMVEEVEVPSLLSLAAQWNAPSSTYLFGGSDSGNGTYSSQFWQIGTLLFFLLLSSFSLPIPTSCPLYYFRFFIYYYCYFVVPYLSRLFLSRSLPVPKRRVSK